MAALLAGDIGVPAGFWFATWTGLLLAFIGAAVLFLPLFVFLPKLIQRAMKADEDAVFEAFGKNEQVKNSCRTFFFSMAGLFLAQVPDPVTDSAECRADYGNGGMNNHENSQKSRYACFR